ncbi:lipoate--protein ligase family protein [Synechococcus sp. CBW1107]|uniref:lipoate--protein ligase family protein n=1 Tax=Synechococcus sp. CBW1107 TaxID=2789857 RepID=UPI002AD2D0E3|nr:lipoate--protein ligase family protein [Synechococcus sp. CBW1107]CAK6691837.1 Octanoyltransferase LipM [Synechococcus sp. CBW1107]
MSPPLLWRWIPPLTAPGRIQMAIDRWMLQQLLRGGPPMLRLYRWSAPALSLGRHQQRWPDHWRTAGVELVRRPSGGRAVLHHGELTYALVMQPQLRSREAVYRHCCLWLQHALASAGQPLQFGQAAASTAAQRSSCFATATAADLVAGDGSKRIGSAQLWQGAALLQHGSLLLDPPIELWRRLFGVDPPRLAPLPWDAQQLELELRRAAERHLCGGALIEQPLSPEEWSAIRALEPGAAV